MNSVEIAKQKLQETDWTVLSDVDTALLNRQDFVVYRSALRKIAINNLIFATIPEEPEPVWSTTQVE